MKKNHLLRWLLPLSAAVAAVGCGGESCDPVHRTEVCIENRSSYHLRIVSETWSGFLIPEVLELESGGTFTAMDSAGGGFPGWDPASLASVYTVHFGADVSTLHRGRDGDAYHNFADFKAYVRTEPDSRHEVFTFTFTDADYEHALLHPYRPNEDMNR